MTTRLPSKESRGRRACFPRRRQLRSRGFSAYLRTAPAEALAGQDAGLVPVGDPLVLAEQVADLALAHADVAGRDVGVLAEVAVELGHERLAEPHDLGVRAALRVEVRAALGAADRHAGQGVLEDLLEAEELDDPEVDRWVEPQAALVGPERGVELDPEAPVDVHLSGVVHPRHPEDDLPLRLAQPLDDRRVGVLGVLRDHRAEAVQHLVDGLVELGLARVAAQHLVVDGVQLLVQHPCRFTLRCAVGRGSWVRRAVWRRSARRPSPPRRTARAGCAG